MNQIARGIFILGVVLIVISGLVYLAGKANLPLGRLPGDIRYQSGNVTCFFPLATMVLISVLLTIVLNLVARFLNK